MQKKANSRRPSRPKPRPLDGLANAHFDGAELPQYTVVAEGQGSVEPTSSTLPPYSERGPLQPRRDTVLNDVHTPDVSIPIRSPVRWSAEHRYDIVGTHGTRSRPWATLKVTSKEPRLSKARVYGGQNVSGSVEIDLDTTRTIRSITLTLHGVIMTTSLRDDSYTFLNYNTTVWTRRDGNPTPTSPSPSASPLSSRSTTSDRISFSPPTSPIDVTRGDLPSLARLLHPEYIITPFILPSPSMQAEYDGIPPPSPTSPTSPANSTPSIKGASDGKLLGRYKWPFSFPFPTEIDVSGKKLGSSAIWTTTPPSTQGRGTNLTIKYYLTLNISHGNFRKVGRVDAPLIYVPATEPDAVSSLCRAAYLAREAPPSPLVDSLGWKNLPQVSICGQVFRHRALDVTCTLSLANPQCYTQGTTIPCFLTTSSSDFEALNSLVPKTVYVRLMRWIKYFEKPEFQMRMGDEEMIETSQEICRAVWCLPPIEGNPQERYTRRIQGEIYLDPQLQPSCSTRFFSVRYTVELLPFHSNNLFQSENGPTEVLVAHEVRIATKPGKGPTPVALTASSLWLASNSNQSTDAKIDDFKFAYDNEAQLTKSYGHFGFQSLTL